MNILFVCIGDTCRSPMAEAIMDDAVDRSSILHGDVKVKSAGTFACEGASPTDEAVRVMDERGLSMDKKGATQFTRELAAWADVILAMSAEQFEHMEVIAPEETAKMSTLLGYVNDVPGEPIDTEFDVIDPFDEGIDEYRECAAQLEKGIDSLVRKLEREAKK